MSIYLIIFTYDPHEGKYWQFISNICIALYEKEIG